MRLAGQAKLGYYPTPDFITARLSSGFIPPHNAHWNACDPFCGTGSALANFHAPTSYGIELDQARAADAQTLLSHVLHTDAFYSQVDLHATGLLFLNPPYDWDPVSNIRLETKAVHHFLPLLQTHGWLVLVIPRNQLEHLWDVLIQATKIHGIWQFPDPEYADFGQIILVAEYLPSWSGRLNQKWQTWATEYQRPQTLPHFEEHDVQTLYLIREKHYRWFPALDAPLSPRWALPSHIPYHRFQQNPVRPETVYEALATNTAVWNSLITRTAPPKSLAMEDPIHTPLTLHRGHLATLLTAGRLTGAIGRGNQRHLVKGRVLRDTVVTSEEVNEDGSSTRKEETRYRIELMTVHPDGTCRTWTQSPANKENSHDDPDTHTLSPTDD